MIRRWLALRRAVSKLEVLWPEGGPFSNVTILRQRPEKTVLAVDSACGPVVAIFFDHARTSIRAEGVAFAHQNLAEKLGAEAVPRLIHVDQAEGLVVTERILGPDLGHILKGRAPGDIENAVRSAGRWLRALHDSVPRKPAPLETTSFLPLQTEPLGTEMQRLLDLIGSAPLPQVKFHADFKPHNVMIDGSRVVAVDLTNTRFRPAGLDAGHFLAMAGANYLRGGHAAGPITRIGLPLRLVEPFEAGYGRSIGTEAVTELKALDTITKVTSTERRRRLPDTGARQLRRIMEGCLG